MKLLGLVSPLKNSFLQYDQYDIAFYIELMIRFDDSNAVKNKIGIALANPKKNCLSYINYAKAIEFINKYFGSKTN